MHITETNEKRWIQNRLENSRSMPNFAAETKQRLLNRIIAAEGLERYQERCLEKRKSSGSNFCTFAITLADVSLFISHFVFHTSIIESKL